MTQRKHLSITQLPDELIYINLPQLLRLSDLATMRLCFPKRTGIQHHTTPQMTTADKYMIVMACIADHINTPKKPCSRETQQAILDVYPIAHTEAKADLVRFVNNHIQTHFLEESNAVFKGLEENTLKDLSEHLERTPFLLLARDPDGDTLLHTAINVDNNAIIIQLLNAKALITIPNYNGLTPLDLAVKTSDQELIEQIVAILRNGTEDINAKDSDGNTLLHWVTQERNIRMVQTLIQAGANQNARNHIGETPLLVAAQEGTIEMVTALVQAGADVTLPNKNGLTALHNAIEGGPDSPDRRNLVEILVNAGAVITDPLLKMARENQPKDFNPYPNAFQPSTIYGYLKGVHRNNSAQHNGRTCASSA